MTVLRIVLLAALCSGWLMSNLGQVYACSCVTPRTPSEQLGVSSLVFAGEAVSVREDQPFLGIDRLPANGPTTVEFKIDTVWKGATTDTITLETAGDEASCGFTFIEGQEYLVYSRDGETVSLCSRTRSIGAAQDDLDALGEGIGPKPNPTGETSNVAGGCGLSSGSSLVSADAALFGLFAGLLWFRRRNQG